MDALIIEDDSKTAHVLARGLNEAGLSVDLAPDGASGLRAAQRGEHRVIILDLHMPALDGWQVLEALRRTRRTPVMLLTGRAGTEDKVRGLAAGADDYVVKPFALPEVLARVQAILRRADAPRPGALELCDLRLDTVSRCATRGGARIRLTPREFALLHYFMQHIGTPLTASMIARQVWGIHFDTQTNVVAVAVRRLRAKIDDDYPDKLVHTVAGLGYVMQHRPR